MIRAHNNQGFSLTEMLIATGIMAIGLVMVATIFPVGVKLTSMSTERTIGAVVADEAFAKIQLYGLRPFMAGGTNNWPVADPNVECSDFQYVNLYDAGSDGITGTPDDPSVGSMLDDTDDFLYPSTVVPSGDNRNYHWSALCRRVGAKDVQVTVFVTRKVAAASQYRAWDPVTSAATSDSNWPKPIPVNVSFDPASPKQLVIVDDPGSWSIDESRYFFDDGYTIVDNHSGRLYRVLEVIDAVNSDDLPDTLVLQNDWVDNVLANETIWVVPPALGSDRYPCVGVYQKVLRFDNIN